MRAIKRGQGRYWFRILLVYIAVLMLQFQHAHAIPSFAPSVLKADAAQQDQTTANEQPLQPHGALPQKASYMLTIGQRSHLFDGSFECELEKRTPFSRTKATSFEPTSN